MRVIAETRYVGMAHLVFAVDATQVESPPLGAPM
jgi:hypothetical protein